MTGLEAYDVTEEKLSSVHTLLSHAHLVSLYISVSTWKLTCKLKEAPRGVAQLGGGALPPLLPSHTTGYSPRELSLYSVLHMCELVEQKHRHI